MRIALAVGLWVTLLSTSYAQYPGNGAANPYSPPDSLQKRNPFSGIYNRGDATPRANNQVRGNRSPNPYDPDNVNPYGPGGQYRPGNP